MPLCWRPFLYLPGIALPRDGSIGKMACREMPAPHLSPGQQSRRTHRSQASKKFSGLHSNRLRVHLRLAKTQAIWRRVKMTVRFESGPCAWEPATAQIGRQRNSCARVAADFRLEYAVPLSTVGIGSFPMAINPIKILAILIELNRWGQIDFQSCCYKRPAALS